MLFSIKNGHRNGLFVFLPSDVSPQDVIISVAYYVTHISFGLVYSYDQYTTQGLFILYLCSLTFCLYIYIYPAIV
jgi:hypothetical protein